MLRWFWTVAVQRGWYIRTMKRLDTEAILPLTCTRDGVCCHGHVIWVNPWEVATLAAGTGLSVPEFRARYLDAHGTRLAFDGPPDRRGKPGCRLYHPERGCTAHAHRPLTCRMYPLGRSRLDGTVHYYYAGDTFPCIELCPTVTQLPTMTVGAYLAGQDIAPSEAAHDAYARVIYGLAAVARRIIDLGGAEVDRLRVGGFFDECQRLSPEARSAILPEQWMELATAPKGLDVADPAAFAEAHGAQITGAVQRAASAIDGALTEAVILYLAIAVHLAPTVGADLTVMRQLVLD